jgi:hypothetical protein
MVLTRRRRQAITAESHPLRAAGILEQVFTCLATTSSFALCGREWAAAYAVVGEQYVCGFDLLFNN